MTMTMRLLRALPRQSFQYRGLSTRASRILSALDLPIDSVIPGVYDGQWKGSGEVVESKCPATGEVIGRIRTVGFVLHLPYARGTELIIGNEGGDSGSNLRVERSFSPCSQDARSEAR